MLYSTSSRFYIRKLSGGIVARYGNRRKAKGCESEWGQRRPSTSHTRPRHRDGMRAAEFRRWREIDLAWISIGAHHDLGPRCCAVSRCATPRVQSSIITAHAKMQFKLQVHVISRPRRGKRFRPARRSVSNDPIKCMRSASAPPRFGNARLDRYIHHDVIFVALHKQTRKCTPVTGEKGNATSVTRALRHSRKWKKKNKKITYSRWIYFNPV